MKVSTNVHRQLFARKAYLQSAPSTRDNDSGSILVTEKKIYFLSKGRPAVSTEAKENVVEIISEYLNMDIRQPTNTNNLNGNNNT